MLEEINAVIQSTRIEIERGMLSMWITVDYGGAVQGFGGYCLYKDLKNDKKNYAGHFIYRCIEVAGVESWDQLPGKAIRVRKEPQWNSTIKAVGHIIKDDWFNPLEDFEKAEEEKFVD